MRGTSNSARSNCFRAKSLTNKPWFAGTQIFQIRNEIMCPGLFILCCKSRMVIGWHFKRYIRKWSPPSMIYFKLPLAASNQLSTEGAGKSGQSVSSNGCPLFSRNNSEAEISSSTRKLPKLARRIASLIWLIVPLPDVLCPTQFKQGFHPFSLVGIYVTVQPNNTR